VYPGNFRHPLRRLVEDERNIPGFQPLRRLISTQAQNRIGIAGHDIPQVKKGD
jgi:hypothetical protein